MNQPNRHDSNERWAEFAASGSFFDCYHCKRPVHESEVDWIRIHHPANHSEPAQLIEEPFHKDCVRVYIDRQNQWTT